MVTLVLQAQVSAEALCKEANSRLEAMNKIEAVRYLCNVAWTLSHVQLCCAMPVDAYACHGALYSQLCLLMGSQCFARSSPSKLTCVQWR